MLFISNMNNGLRQAFCEEEDYKRMLFIFYMNNGLNKCFENKNIYKEDRIWSRNSKADFEWVERRDNRI